MPKVRKIAPGLNRFRIVQGTNISNKLLATMFFLLVTCFSEDNHMDYKSKFVHSFLETTFLHVSCYPVIVSRKYIYGFSKSAPTPRYKILNSRYPLVMRSRKAGLPFATRAWKRELCP